MQALASTTADSTPTMTLGGIVETIIWIIAAGTGSLMLALYFFQNKLVYIPGFPLDARTVFISPEAVGLEDFFEEVMIPTQDGVKIQAYLFRHRNANEVPTILFCHGNAGNLSYRLYNISRLFSTAYLGCNVMIISYRGYGKSEGSPSEKGLQRDAQAALDYLCSLPDIDPHKIVLFGRSLGGAVALHLAAANEDKLAAVMVENTFTSIPDMIDVVMPWLSYFKMLCTNKWNSLQTVKDISLPILFISGERDELVPPAMMTRLYDAAESSAKKKFLSFPQGQHMDTESQSEYYESIRAWFVELGLLEEEED
ncbi:bem46 protein, variant [Balamuthia mandrillaris]